jgi:hypothetical protein
MRLHVLTVALALGVGSWAPAQTTSSSSSPQQLPLPAAPRSPKSLAECDAYQKRLDDQMAQISQQHSACLESFKEDRQGDNNLICSRSECQSLHTLLYGPHKTAGEQQVTSCQAAVQRYQARSAAQQQGIQTLGNAIGDLLTSSPSTPIDSQNDLANYENQQNGQPVLGDDASSGIPVDDSAKRVMSSSSNSDGSPSVQSQLDSVIDDDMSNTSTSSASSSNSVPTPAPRGSTAEAECAAFGLSNCTHSNWAVAQSEQQQLDLQQQFAVGSVMGPESIGPDLKPNVIDCVHKVVDMAKALYGLYWDYGTCSNDDHAASPPVPPVPPPPSITPSQGPNNAPIPGPLPAPQPKP